MNQKIVFIGSSLAFCILAGISCWATEQSLHLLLPTGWPRILVWGITISFFIVASMGTMLIVDSLNSTDFIDNRKLKLWGGTILVLFFWLIMSMPTNTHTFFYNDQIGSVITKDIKTTNLYLQQLIDKGSGNIKVLDDDGKKIKDNVEEQRTHIVAQFNGDEPPYKRGNGQKIGKHLMKINLILNSSIQQDVRYNSSDITILNSYHAQINKALEQALKPHCINNQSINDAKLQIKRLEAIRDSIDNQITIGQLSETKIKQVESLLKEGYTIIYNNQKFIDFEKNTGDKEVYTTENTETRTKRLASVIEVFFIDFIGGKYPASFWYYVILSILVDIAAFIFFDIAIKKI